CRWLGRRFAGLCVLHGDALDIGEMMASAHRSSVGVVLRGLPMRAIHPAAAARCANDAFEHMPASGAVVRYTYRLAPPVDPDSRGLALEAAFLGREWRNVPPMGIWCYRRPAREDLPANAPR